MQLLWEIDYAVSTFLHASYGALPVWDALVYFCAEYAQYAIGAYFFYFVITSARNRADQLLMFASTISAIILARLVVVEVIRLWWDRARPFELLQYTPPFPEISASFPSGHATFFFALAMMVYLHDRTHAWIFIISAICISIARVIAGVHFPSDITAGAIIGCSVSLGVYYYIEPFIRSRVLVQKRATDIL